MRLTGLGPVNRSASLCRDSLSMPALHSCRIRVRYKPKHGLSPQTRRTWSCHRATATSKGPLVDASWLQRELEDVALLDCRTYDDYLAGHIPGAVHISWPQDCCSGEHQLQTNPDMYVPMLEKKGVTADKPVVVYDQALSYEAAKVWWALKVYGHPDARLLLGGLDAWLSQNGETELYEPCPLKLCSIYEAEPQPQHLAHLGDMPDGAVVYVAQGAAQQLHDACMQSDWPAATSVLESLTGAGFSKSHTVVFAAKDEDYGTACLMAACWQHVTSRTGWAVVPVAEGKYYECYSY